MPTKVQLGRPGWDSRLAHHHAATARTRLRLGSPRQRPHPLIGKAGAVPRLFAPQNVWTGTLGAAQNAVILRLDPAETLLGELPSVCFEVQLRSCNIRSPNDPASEKRSVQVRPVRRLTSFGRTTFFCNYGPFVFAAIGLRGNCCTRFGRPAITMRIRTVIPRSSWHPSPGHITACSGLRGRNGPRDRPA